ncbi:MAG: NAD(P)H-dependent oxidoreductase [Eubacterium sp.]|nr:NAD(P)H-dependent oxidoreductase [Eubacterium sp.]MCM1418870.1 NAD(P)H-dependent oxidoreductase [Roseburia sp.]
MKVVIIHGQSHEGTTCHIARTLAEKLGGETVEFFLPRDFDRFCVGCTACFTRGEEHCPHYEKLKPLVGALDEADVILLASPVYVYHVTGAMKAFLDHLGYRWMVHRPEEKMFAKQVVCISTAAGAGTKSANRDMADSAFFWGCARVYRLGVAVRATDWSGVSEKTKAATERKAAAIADRIKKRVGRVKPSVKTKLFFAVMRMLQKSGWNPTDEAYWREKGWLGKGKPWGKRV